VTNHFIDSLSTFIQEEVLPLLRARNGASTQLSTEDADVLDASAASEDDASNYSVDGDSASLASDASSSD